MGGSGAGAAPQPTTGGVLPPAPLDSASTPFIFDCTRLPFPFPSRSLFCVHSCRAGAAAQTGGAPVSCGSRRVLLPIACMGGARPPTLPLPCPCVAGLGALWLWLLRLWRLWRLWLLPWGLWRLLHHASTPLATPRQPPATLPATCWQPSPTAHGLAASGRVPRRTFAAVAGPLA